MNNNELTNEDLKEQPESIKNDPEEETENSENTEEDIEEVDEDNQGNNIAYLYLSLIILIIIIIIKYKLYNYIWPFFSTYIFVHIRYVWILIIFATVYGSFKIVKYIKQCYTKIRDCITYSKYPLKDKETANSYRNINGIGKNKHRKAYIIFMKIWFALMVIVYSIVLLILVFLIMLSCFMVGHFLSWMDYFWFLR